MENLMRAILARVPEYAHYTAEQIAVSASYCRSHRRAGLLAYVVPLKFKNGSPVERRVRGKRILHWAMVPTFRNGQEVLYIMSFLLPRYWKQTFRQRLETVVHELYHIHPSFNGDLRRFAGRNRLHGDMKEYDAQVKRLTDIFLDTGPPEEALEFLRIAQRSPLLDREYLRAHHFPEPRPKLLHVEDSL